MDGTEAFGKYIELLSGYSAETQIAVLNNSNLADSIKIMIAKHLGLSTATVTTTAATTASGVAATGAATGFKAFTASIKSATIGLATFLTTNPIGWAILAAGAIAGVVGAVDLLTESYDEASEASAKAREEFQTTQSEINSLNSELETTQSRIDELKAQGGLTITEQEELTRLEAQNERLRTQIELKEKLAEWQGQQAAEAAKNTLTNDQRGAGFRTQTASDGTQYVTWESGSNIIDETRQKQEELNKITEEYNVLKEKQDALTPETSSWLPFDDTEYEKNAQALTAYEGQIKSLQSSISDNLSIIDQEYQSFFDSEGNILEGCGEIVTQVSDLYDDFATSTDKSTKKQEKLESILSKPTFEKYKNELIEMAKASDDAGISAEDITDNYFSLQKAAQDYGITLDELVSAINSMAGVVDIDEIQQQMLDSFSTDELKNEWTEFTSGMSNEEIKMLYGIYQSENTSAWSLDDWNLALENARAEANELGEAYAEVQQKYSAFYETTQNITDALGRSASGSGMAVADVDNITEAFKDLKSFDADKLFENTANGIRLNTTALRELSVEYEEQTKLAFVEKLSELGQEYDNLTQRLAECTKGTSEYNSILAQRDEIQTQINDVKMLKSQFDGLTSSYNKWLSAQSSANEGDMYDNVTSGLDDLKDLYKEGLVGTDDFRTGVDFMTYQDMSTASVAELVKAYEKARGKMNRYFTEGQDGCVKFLEDLQSINSEWAQMDENGEWKIDFDAEDVAKRLGISVEAVQSIMRKLSDYGFDINLEPTIESMEDLANYAETANDKLKELGKTNVTFNFSTTDTEYLTDQIEQAQSVLNKFKNSDGKVNLELEGAKEAQTVLATLLTQKQSLNAPAVMSVDTDKASGDIGNLIGYLQDFQTSYNDIQIDAAIGADTTKAQEEVQSVLTKIESIPPEVLTKLGLNDEEFQQAVADLKATSVNVDAGVNLSQESLDTVTATIASITPKMIVNAGVDDTAVANYTAEEKSGTVKMTVDDTAVQSYTVPEKTGTAKYNAKLNSWTPPIKYGTVIYNSSTGYASGTAHLKGTAYSSGSAYASGDWSVKRSEVALGGEEAEELVVRNGRYFTVGSQGAEFFQARKGDIIFNAAQTREIFAKGKLTSGNTRGRALHTGTAYDSGSGRFYASGKKVKSSSQTYKASSKSSSKSSSSKSTTKKAAESTLEFIDYAEIKLNRLSSATDAFIQSAENSEKLSSILTYYQKAIKNIDKEISANQQAAALYKKQANAVKLNNSIKAKIANGSINISQYGEKTREKIQEYQEWYEKMLDCTQAIKDLKQQQKELAATKLDTLLERYTMKTDYYDSKRSTLESRLNYLETAGSAIGSSTQKSYYSQLIGNEKSTLSQYKAALSAYTKELNRQISSGLITKGSDEYYEAQQKIQELNQSIAESNTTIKEFEQELRNLGITKLQYAFDVVQRTANKIENAFSLKEAQGKVITSEDYQKQINSNNALIKKQEALRAAYVTEQKYYSANSEKYQELADEIDSCDSSINDLKISNEELKNSIKELRITKLEYALNTVSRAVEKFRNSISLKEAKGLQITEKDYTKDIQNNNDMIEKNLDLIKEYQSQQKAYAPESEKYQEFEELIASCEDNINDLQIANEELKDSIRETRWTAFNELQEQLDNSITEIEFLRDMLNDTFVDANGKITEHGYANISLIGQGIAIQKQVIADYTEAIAKLDDELENGTITQAEHNEYQLEYISIIRDSASAIKDYEDELIDMYKSQLEAQTDALIEEIDLRREALDAKKDYYDYDKTIRSKNKDIQSLKSQIAALEGTTTAAGKAKLAQLKAELEEAQEDLDDTIYEHNYDIQTSGYDKMEEAIQESMENTLQDLESNTELQQQIVDDMLNKIKDSYSSAYEEINSIIKQSGVIVTDTTKEVVDGLKTMSDAVQSIKEATAPIQTVEPNKSVASISTTEIDTSVKTPTVSSSGTVSTPSTSSSNTASSTTSSSSTTQNNSTSTQSSKASSIKISKTSASIYVGKSFTLSATPSPSNAKVTLTWTSSNTNVATVSSGKVTGKKAGSATITVKDSISGKTAKCSITVKNSSSSSTSSIWSGISKDTSSKGNKNLDIKTSIVDRMKYNGYASDKASRKKLYSNLGGSGTYTGTSTQNTWMINQLKKKGYASGAKSATSGYHWYDEYGIGSEIYITKDGILNQFDGGETIFNSDMVKNLWNLSQKTPELLLRNMSSSSGTIGDVNNTENKTTSINFDVDFNIDKLGQTSTDELKKMYEEFYNYANKRITAQAHNYGVKRKV